MNYHITNLHLKNQPSLAKPIRVCPESLLRDRFSNRAFTLVEMILVVTIIGLLAALALPHLAGFGKSNSMTAATRQLLDDVSLARLKALANRTTVYVVFIPPGFWTGPNTAAYNSLDSEGRTQVTNLSSGQYTSYALVSLRSVGDQPGRPYPRYLSQWKHLPEGVFIAPNKFFIATQFVDTNAIPQKTFNINPFASNNIPFPSIDKAAPTPFLLPTISFNSSGQLTSQADELIALTRGSIFYARKPDTTLDLANADAAETPPGNSTNNYNIIHIDWLTGRAKIERQEIR